LNKIKEKNGSIKLLHLLDNMWFPSAADAPFLPMVLYIRKGNDRFRKLVFS